MVDTGVLVVVPLRFRLVAVDLNRRAVDIERDGLHPFALTLGPNSATGHLQHRLAQNRDVRRLRHNRCEARQCRLRGEL